MSKWLEQSDECRPTRSAVFLCGGSGLAVSYVIAEIIREIEFRRLDEFISCHLVSARDSVRKRDYVSSGYGPVFANNGVSERGTPILLVGLEDGGKWPLEFKWEYGIDQPYICDGQNRVACCCSGLAPRPQGFWRALEDVRLELSERSGVTRMEIEDRSYYVHRLSEFPRSAIRNTVLSKAFDQGELCSRARSVLRASHRRGADLRCFANGNATRLRAGWRLRFDWIIISFEPTIDELKEHWPIGAISGNAVRDENSSSQGLRFTLFFCYLWDSSRDYLFIAVGENSRSHKPGRDAIFRNTAGLGGGELKTKPIFVGITV